MSEPAPKWFSLKEAAATFFAGQSITARSLQTEIEKGNLRASNVAGKYVVTVEAIEKMIKKNAGAVRRRIAERNKCRGRPKDQDSTSGNGKGENRSTSSSTDRQKQSQDVARRKLEKLQDGSRNTSPKRGKPPAEVVQLKSSSRRS